ncbi:MAG: hypoxanthine phosphoribosyltransferase [Deltaproteobacteria bacterium]|nr:hypoxanthine phosphoribosyltransferase [Deltaproteobacteria bacterium]
MMEGKPEILFSKTVIEGRVRELAGRISGEYAGKNLLIVGVLKGAFVFMADLVRGLDIPCRVDFVRLASYGAGSTSSGKVRITKDLETDIAGRHVLVVEDIVDTGLTLAWLVETLRQRQPASLRVCVFLDKSQRRQVPFTADYVGFTIPDAFVVGYGLDFNEDFRFLPDVCVLREIA